MTQSGQSQPLLWERGARWLGSRLAEYRVAFAASLLTGFGAYMFAFTNKLINHDETGCLFTKGATVSSGRWGLGLLDSIFPNVSMPWIYGVMAILLVSTAICVMLRIFSIENKLLQVLLAGTVMVFPSLIGTMGYMFTAAPYMLAFLLSVLAVRFVQLAQLKEPRMKAAGADAEISCHSQTFKRRKQPVWISRFFSRGDGGNDPAFSRSRLIQRFLKYTLPGAVCCIASLSIYQPYISVTASLLVLLLITQLLHGEKTAAVIRRGFFCLGFLVVCLGLYYAATLCFNWLLQVQLNEYASTRLRLDLSSIVRSILLAYNAFFESLRSGLHGLIPTDLSCWSHFLLLICCALLFLLWGISRQTAEAGRYALLAALVALLPLCINCMYLLSSPDAIHTLMLYGFVAVYILAAVLAQVCLPLFPQGRLFRWLRQGALHGLTLLLAVIVAINLYIANAAFLNLHLRYENSMAFYTALLAQLEQTPHFDETTKLAVIGDYREPAFYSEHLPFTDTITGIKGFSPDTYSNNYFLEYYLGLSVPFASQEEISRIRAGEEFAQMAVYPYYGCIKIIGDICVVKLSE